LVQWDEMLFMPQPLAAAQVHRAPLMRPPHDIDPLSQQQGDFPIRAVATVGQDHIVALQRGMQAMKEHGRTGLLALDATDCHREDRSTGPRQHDHEAGDRKAEPWRLAPRLRLRLWVCLRVRHGDPRALHELDRTAVPVPGGGHLLLEPLTALVHQAVQPRFGKTLARLAVPTGKQ
jgi:hypothetical protein